MFQPPTVAACEVFLFLSKYLSISSEGPVPIWPAFVNVGLHGLSLRIQTRPQPGDEEAWLKLLGSLQFLCCLKLNPQVN